MSKVSGKKLAKLAARIVELNPQVIQAEGDDEILTSNFISFRCPKSEEVLTIMVRDLVSLAASVLSQSEPKNAPDCSEAVVVEALRERCQKFEQQKVAAEIGMGKTHISHVLNGKSGIGEKLANALGFEQHVTYTLKGTKNTQGGK